MYEKLAAFLGVLLACSARLDAAAVILNEYNAVGDLEFLEDNAQDTYWGRVEGNGGDWFELVVITDHLDMRGWQLVLSDNSGYTETLTLTDHVIWSDLRSGTIVTVSEELANNADDYDPTAGQWWLNVKAANGTSGTYIEDSNFRVNNNGWQLTILDASDAVVFGPAGEGIQPPSGVGNQEVCKLEADPGPSITPLSNYNPGQSSTFGAPNIWGGGTHSQDFSGLRSGVVQCTENADCDDGLFCNGAEVCTNGLCQSGPVPCPGLMCDEAADLCVECLSGADCDDSDPCTSNACTNGSCQYPAIPGCGDTGPPADADGDDVIDLIDECQDTPEGEPVDARGCACSQLDDDADGVDDCTDECPGTLPDEMPDEQGCTCRDFDDDGDGIDDCTDECPDTAADDTPDDRGCACRQLDEDQDDVNNCDDRCPDTPSGATVDSDGCSCFQLDPDGDDDGDDVLNCLDECAGTPAGDEVDDLGCTITPAEEETPEAALPPDDTGDADENANTDSPPGNGRNAGGSASAGQRGGCGFSSPASLVFMLAGWVTMRFARRRTPGPPTPYRP